jgi:hypothetical protein
VRKSDWIVFTSIFHFQLEVEIQPFLACAIECADDTGVRIRVAVSFTPSPAIRARGRRHAEVLGYLLDGLGGRDRDRAGIND